MSAHRHAASARHFAHARAGSSDRENSDGVVGVPAGGGRRARTARLPVGDGAGRCRARSRGAQPSPLEHRPEHAPVDRRGRRGRAGGRRGTRPARVRLRLRHDGLDARHGALDDPGRAGADDPRQTPQAVAPGCRARARLAGRPPGHRVGRVLRCPTGFHDPRNRGRPALGLGVGTDQPPGSRCGILAGAGIRFAHHVFGVDERRDHRTVRARPLRDSGHPQRH